MDYQFPRQLFPFFYNSGPPDLVQKHSEGRWGSYDRVLPEGGNGPLSSWTFLSQHRVSGETWRLTEPVPVPLLSPKSALLSPSTVPDPLDFAEHMQNFYMDHSQDAFGCMTELLADNFAFIRRKKKSTDQPPPVNMQRTDRFFELLKVKACHFAYHNSRVNRYCNLLWDVVPDIPPPLLGSLLHEELAAQREQALFSEAATGGALLHVPFSGAEGDGCLLHAGGRALNLLNFHRVKIPSKLASPDDVDTSSSSPLSFQLTAPVRQISCASLLGDCCACVRSDHLCGVWRFCEDSEPRLLQVVTTKPVATCVSVSPHVLGEVLVASESGAADLWTVGKVMQRVRQEESNLYFNAKSWWRWCEFTAHPRVMLYADRTGAELSDMRVSPSSGQTLFRISSTPECRQGERLTLCRYLSDAHSFHHLVTTQHSAYVMDERFPGVSMLKWDHMMSSPPIFCHVPISGSDPAGLDATQVLLGSQRSQEITLLQYSGGRAEACVSRGPPRSLLRPKESLKLLPPLIPHRHEAASRRLSAPAAGLACVLRRDGAGRSMCVLQLTEAGDIFAQTLLNRDSPTAPEGEVISQHSPPPETGSAGAEGGSDEEDEDETLVSSLKKRALSDSYSEESEAESRTRRLKRMKLQVVVNEPEETSRTEGEDPAEGSGEKEAESAAPAPVPAAAVEEQQKTPEPQVSSSSAQTWKRWLQKVVLRPFRKKPRPPQQHLLTVPTEDLLPPPSPDRTGVWEKEREELQAAITDCMYRRSLLLLSSTPACLDPPPVQPLPQQVDPDAWVDPLSCRLTAAWQGESRWRAWWAEELGLDREDRAKALRRRRRRQKEARRRAGQGLELSGDFTSSYSSQSELEDLSGSSSWSRASSLREWGQGGTEEGAQSQPERGEEREAVSPPEFGASAQTSADITLVRATETQNQQPTPQTRTRSQTRISQSQTWVSESTTSWQSQSKHRADQYLDSLFSSQPEPSQDEIADTPPSFLRALRSSQSSQRRLGPTTRTSQRQQQKKRGSQMGF